MERRLPVDDIILPDTSEDTLGQLLSGFDATLMTGGHTHTQQLRRVRNAWYFNPGSVGLAYNWQLPGEQFQADPWAEYAIVPPRGKVSASPFVTIPLMLRNWPALFAPVANPMLNRPSRCIDRRLEEEDASVSQDSVTGLLEQAGTCPARALQVNGAR